jgi:hypothetical protein
LKRKKNNPNNLLLLLLIGIITLVSCTEVYKTVESDFIIKVSGTKDLKFNGHYSFVAAGKTPVPQNVVGTVPIEYQGKGVIALCLFRKTTIEGSLKVEILKGEKVAAGGETVVPYGVVSLKTPVPGTDNIIIQILKKFIG